MNWGSFKNHVFVMRVSDINTYLFAVNDRDYFGWPCFDGSIGDRDNATGRGLNRLCRHHMHEHRKQQHRGTDPTWPRHSPWYARPWPNWDLPHFGKSWVLKIEKKFKFIKNKIKRPDYGLVYRFIFLIKTFDDND